MLEQELQVNIFKYHKINVLAICMLAAFMQAAKLYAQTSEPTPRHRSFCYKLDGNMHLHCQKILKPADSIDFYTHISQKIQRWHMAGYWSAGIDSVIKNVDTTTFYLFKGTKFKAYAKYNSTSTYTPKGWHNEFVQPLYRKTPAIIQYLENRGYPFASLRFDSLKLSQDTVIFVPRLEPGPLILFDTLVRLGDVALNSRFIQKYSRVVPGKPFSAKTVHHLKPRLEALPFLKVDEPVVVHFTGQRAAPLVKLSSLKRNQLNGILGLLPNEAEGGKLLLTGQINFALHNLFKAGKTVTFDWINFKPRSQRLDVDYYDPTLINSPVECRLKFRLFKEDSLFLNRQFKAEFSYFEPDLGHFGVVAQAFSSRSTIPRLSLNTQPGADLRVNGFGFTYALNWSATIDPVRNGTSFRAEAVAGNKTIIKPPLDDLPKVLPNKSAQYSLGLLLHHANVIYRPWRYYLRINAAGLFNDYLFVNELLRIGGLNSLRGFNENYFFVDKYWINTAELRYFIETSTYMYLFVDQAFISSNTITSKFYDTPFGMGLGLSFTIPAGQINIVYALGKEKNNPASFNNSKIHFGFIGLF